MSRINRKLLTKNHDSNWISKYCDISRDIITYFAKCRLISKNAFYIIHNQYWKLNFVPSSAVITRSNIARYFIQHCFDWITIKIECQITNYIPYIALTGELWGVFCEDSVEIERVISAPHCIWCCACQCPSRDRYQAFCKHFCYPFRVPYIWGTSNWRVHADSVNRARENRFCIAR